MDGIGALPAGRAEGHLVAAVRAALEVVPGCARAGLAVSGGADSVALAHLAARARPDLRWVVLHVRHGLRDDAADARAAARCAAAIGAAHDERGVVVQPSPRTGLEAAARAARYATLRAAGREQGLAAVCLGHTADDRAETVLLNLARGAGLRGLGAMRASRREGGLLLLRPLLRLRRTDVRGWAAAAGLEWVEDPMNRDPRLRRTRVRAEVLPALARLSGGPGDPIGVLCRLADLAADDADALDALAHAHAAAQLVAWGPVRALRTDVLEALARALARRVVRALVAAVDGDARGLPASDVEAVLALRPGKARTVAGGVVVGRGQGWIAAAPPGLEPLAARSLALPGGVDVPEAGVRVVADRHRGAPVSPTVPPRSPGAAGPEWVRLAGRAGFVVRGPRPGDRVRTRARDAPVARLLAEAGIPRPARPVVPVVVDAADEVLWVPGVAARDGAHEPDGFRLWLAPLVAAE